MADAVVFDLDETLLDTSALRAEREARAWGEVAAGLDRVVPYNIAESAIAVRELPARLREQGYPVGVLTHSPRWYADQLLDVFGIRVDALITGSDPYPYKPDPTSLKAIAGELGVAPEALMFVGDSDSDFGAATAAGAISVGVCWSRRTPEGWRRYWPDIAISRPERLFEALAEASRLRPFGEALADAESPRWHWGSWIRLASHVVAAGRYFSTTDARHATQRLSQLILDAKDDPDAATEIGLILSVFAERRAAKGRSFDIVTSVPPRPEAEHDRFDPIRASVASAYGAADRSDILTMRYSVDDYKSLDHEARAVVNAGRFSSQALRGKDVLLVEDVLTSAVGGQAETCRMKMLEAGANTVAILGATVTQEPAYRLCPRCGGLLRTKDGRYGRFIGCSNWRTIGCTYSEDLPS